MGAARRLASFILLSLLIASIVAGCSGGSGERMLNVYLKSNQDQVNRAVSVDERPVRFEVAPGTPARTIGANLVAAGLIKDDLLFEAYVRVNGLANRLEAGTFVLSPAMTLAEIVDALQHAEAASITVTIPEGWRQEQTADYLADSDLFGDALEGRSVQSERYREQATNGDLSGLDPGRYPFIQELPAGSSLEGYLFPATYELPASGATATDLLARQLDSFALQVLPLYRDAVESGRTQMSLHTLLALASIVEREAVVPSERPAIAGVYLNRLAAGMRLEADPTVQYAMGYQEEADQWWKSPVFLSEYSAVDSPYNTYLYPGVPPGPIASPGLSSVQAVLNPDEHDFYYFVALPDGSGGHVFARTFEEHSENVRRYLSGE